MLTGLLSDAGRTVLTKKTGPLVQLPGQWEIDTAELAENAYREEFAATGGWPPEIIGTWVGYWMNVWGQTTNYRNGRYDMTIFEMPSWNRTGTSKTLEPADKVIVEGDILHLSDHGVDGDLRRISLPYVRLDAEEETAAEGVDPAVIGTFGARMNGAYVEWTFHGDRRFTQVTPYEEGKENGSFLTGGGELAILLNGKITRCSYKEVKNGLMLTGLLSDAGRTVLTKKTGPLVQLPFQWTMD